LYTYSVGLADHLRVLRLRGGLGQNRLSYLR
jgi:hypothetical protein